MWKKEYKKNNYYWGLEPAKILKKYSRVALKKGTALDIGCGEGRNSVFLAKNGFTVDAVDKEKSGINKLEKLIVGNNINNINVFPIDILKFKFNKKYDLILAYHSLDFLKLSEIKKLIKKIKKSVNSNGLIIMSVFSVKDLLYIKAVKILKKKEIEKNTFYFPKLKTYRHFFTKEEIKELFKGWEIIHLQQREICDEHGSAEKHKHNIIEFIAKKQDG